MLSGRFSSSRVWYRLNILRDNSPQIQPGSPRTLGYCGSLHSSLYFRGDTALYLDGPQGGIVIAERRPNEYVVNGGLFG